MRFSGPRLLAGAGALSALALAIAGCTTPCDKFKDDPTKYDYLSSTSPPGTPPEQRTVGPFVIAVYRPAVVNKDDLRAAVQKAVQDAGKGTGSVNDYKDDAAYLANFSRRVPYADKPINISFQTQFKSKDLKLGEDNIIVWDGVGEQDKIAIPKAGANNAPKLTDLGGGLWQLAVPAQITATESKGPTGNKNLLVVVSSLEEKSTGGYKFKALPFKVHSNTGNKDVEMQWDGTKDIVTQVPGDTIELFSVEGFKGDPRDIQCHLLTADVVMENKPALSFRQQLSTMFFTVSGSSFQSFTVVTFSGSESDAVGQVKDKPDIKLPEGFPSLGKAYATADELNHATAPQAGDYSFESTTDLQNGVVKFSFSIRLNATGKTPDYADVKFSVTLPAGGTKDWNGRVTPAPQK